MFNSKKKKAAEAAALKQFHDLVADIRATIALPPSLEKYDALQKGLTDLEAVEVVEKTKSTKATKLFLGAFIASGVGVCIGFGVLMTGGAAGPMLYSMLSAISFEIAFLTSVNRALYPEAKALCDAVRAEIATETQALLGDRFDAVVKGVDGAVLTERLRSDQKLLSAFNNLVGDKALEMSVRMAKGDALPLPAAPIQKLNRRTALPS